MPATNKVSTQLLVSPHTRDRARALAIVRHESVAEVNRAALEGGGLGMLETAHAQALEVLYLALDAMKVDRSAALAAMLTQRLHLGDLYTQDDTVLKRFPGKLKAPAKAPVRKVFK